MNQKGQVHWDFRNRRVKFGQRSQWIPLRIEKEKFLSSGHSQHYSAKTKPGDRRRNSHSTTYTDGEAERTLYRDKVTLEKNHIFAEEEDCYQHVSLVRG